MAIDPKLVSIKTAGELPVSDPTDNANFLFYEGEALKRSPMANIYDKVSSGLLPATIATVPEATGFHRYIVHEAGIYTNFLSGGSPIEVTAADLDVVSGVANNEVILEVSEGVATKRLVRRKGDKGDVIIPDGGVTTEKLADNSVTGTKTDFIKKSRNLFFGTYLNIFTRVNDNSIQWTTIPTGFPHKTAIIPIEEGETYHIQMIGNNDRFLIGILNNFPTPATDFTYVDAVVNIDNALKEFTFTNTATGKYLLINVSATGAEPIMQVEKGSVFTEYVNHEVLDKEYIAPIEPDQFAQKTQVWAKEIALEKRKEELTKHIPKHRFIYPSPDFVPTPTVLVTLEDDLVNFKANEKGLKVNVIDTSFQVYLNMPKKPITFSPISTIGIWIYIYDVTKMTSLAVQVWRDAAFTDVETHPTTVKPLKNGWNLFRWSVGIAGGYTQKPIYRMGLSGVTASATVFTVGSIWFEQPPKAQVLFIHDGGYPEFLTTGYPDLKRIGLPCTWALRPSRAATQDGHISESQILGLSMENNNEINFHSWSGAPTSSMTEQQTIDDSYNAIMWLRQRMYSKPFWRAAWTQNLAPYAVSTRHLFYCYPMSTGGEGYMSVFPFADNFSTKWDIKRFSLHGYNSNPEVLIDIFNILKETNGLMVIYTHKVHPTDSGDVTPERWQQFIALCEEGINEGWLEGVTMNMLMERIGVTGEERPADGDWIAPMYENYPDYGSYKLRKMENE